MSLFVWSDYDVLSSPFKLILCLPFLSGLSSFTSILPKAIVVRSEFTSSSKLLSVPDDFREDNTLALCFLPPHDELSKLPAQIFRLASLYVSFSRLQDSIHIVARLSHSLRFYMSSKMAKSKSKGLYGRFSSSPHELSMVLIDISIDPSYPAIWSCISTHPNCLSRTSTSSALYRFILASLKKTDTRFQSQN